MNEFELLVLEMRNTQKEYFRTRDKDTLQKSKALEKRVDDHLKTPSGTIKFDQPDQINSNAKWKTGSIF